MEGRDSGMGMSHYFTLKDISVKRVPKISNPNNSMNRVTTEPCVVPIHCFMSGCTKRDFSSGRFYDLFHVISVLLLCVCLFDVLYYHCTLHVASLGMYW